MSSNIGVEDYANFFYGLFNAHIDYLVSNQYDEFVKKHIGGGNYSSGNATANCYQCFIPPLFSNKSMMRDIITKAKENGYMQTLNNDKIQKIYSNKHVSEGGFGLYWVTLNGEFVTKRITFTRYLMMETKKNHNIARSTVNHYNKGTLTSDKISSLDYTRSVLNTEQFLINFMNIHNSEDDLNEISKKFVNSFDSRFRFMDDLVTLEKV